MRWILAVLITVLTVVDSFAQLPPIQRNVVTTNLLGNAPGVTSFIGWDGSKPVWAIPAGGSGGGATNAVSIVSSNTVQIATATTNLDFQNPNSGNIVFGVTNVLGMADVSANLKALTGDITMSSGGTATTLKNTGTAGTYTKVTFDAQGRETSGASASLASSDFANQGTTTTVLHGNAAGNPSFAAVDVSSAEITGTLKAAAFPALTGDITTSAGALATTLKNTGTAGTYRSVTFDAQGRETSGSNPTTFSGYAISDTSANLAAALTDETGSSGGGLAVFNQSPTIVTPTIASFANANHNHQNSAGGGTLDGAAIGSGTISGSRLPARSIGVTIDGGGSAITSGIKGYLEVPWAGTIISATILGDQSGSIAIETWRTNSSSMPPTRAGVLFTNYLTTAQASTDSTLTGATSLALNTQDRIGFNVITNAASVTRVTLQIRYQ